MALMQKLAGGGGNVPNMMPPAGGPMGMGGPRPMGGMPMGAGQNPSLNMPTVCIVLHGMFNPSQVNILTDPEFFNDIHADVEQECRKYGAVVKVWADKQSIKGDVWVRFIDTASSSNCQRALDRRWFAGQQIIAEFTNEAAWAATVKG